MSAPVRIAVLGSFNVDLVVQAPRFPRPGETLLGGPLARYAGGKGANQAVAAARLGARVAFLGCVGDDEGGALARELFASEGVDAMGLERCSAAPTGTAVITVAAGGENHIVVAPGANHLPNAAWVDARAAAIAAADALMLQLEVPLEAVARAVRIAREAGTRVVLNAAPCQPLPPELLAGLDVLIVNELEHAALGRPAVPLVLVTRGSRGASAIERAADGRVRERSHPSRPVEALDTTAAGDAFCAAATVALLEDPDLDRVLARGTAAGALACTVRGAIPALPTRAALEAFL